MSEEPQNQIRQLSKIQRRVIGALMEKAFTTPDQYPLTLKATTTACNQKSNRDPVVSYTEDQVQDTLDSLREDLLVAEVFTDGGRAPRYRHYMRHKFDFSEAQFAIIAELLLRGRQQPGELRTRASRMVKIDSQQQLRDELTSLQEKGYLQANGPLDRRGVEVDHTFYLPKEGMDIGTAAASAPQSGVGSSAAPPAGQSVSESSAAPAAVEQLENLQSTIADQAETIRNLQSLINDLEDRLQRLERDLGV
ncbi:MAG: YceH family protein [Fuerstiella sp.]